MSLRDAALRDVSSARPVTAELALVVAALVGVSLWHRLVTGTLSATSGSSLLADRFLLGGLLGGGTFVAGLALYAGAYATARDIDVRLALPARDDLRSVALAAVVPVGLVGLTKVVGVLTGVPYNSLTLSAYGADARVSAFLLVTGLGLLVGVPVLVVVCQVLVQGSFERAVGRERAVVPTVLFAGFVLTGTAGGLSTVPALGKLVGAAAFALAVGVALYADGRAEKEWVRRLAYVPVLVLAALVVLSGVAAVESIAEGLFVAAHVGTLGVAAHAYERTDSLLVPALTYVCLLLADDTVVFVFEAGMQSW